MIIEFLQEIKNREKNDEIEEAIKMFPMLDINKEEEKREPVSQEPGVCQICSDSA